MGSVTEPLKSGTVVRESGLFLGQEVARVLTV